MSRSETKSALRSGHLTASARQGHNTGASERVVYTGLGHRRPQFDGRRGGRSGFIEEQNDFQYERRQNDAH